jgi:hypothetical protein
MYHEAVLAVRSAVHSPPLSHERLVTSCFLSHPMARQASPARKRVAPTSRASSPSPASSTTSSDPATRASPTRHCQPRASEASRPSQAKSGIPTHVSEVLFWTSVVISSIYIWCGMQSFPLSAAPTNQPGCCLLCLAADCFVFSRARTQATCGCGHVDMRTCGLRHAPASLDEEHLREQV